MMHREDGRILEPDHDHKREYVEIGLLRKHGMSLCKIAEEIGCAVNTVRDHLDTSETLPVYKRKTSRVTKLWIYC